MQKNLKYFLIILLISSFQSVSAQTPAQRATTPDEQIVVTVNGDPVRADEVKTTAQQMAQQMAQSGQQVDPQKIGSAAMQQVIDGVLLVQEAKRRKLAVDPAEIAKAVEQAETNAGGAEKLDAALTQQGLNRKRLSSLIEDSKLLDKLLAQLSEGIKVSDEEVAAFYKDNPKYFEMPEQVKARHILIKVAPDADEKTKAEARARAEAARQRALEGEDFAALAKEVSEGPSAPSGGDLGFFSKDRMVPAFSEAAFGLKPGEISDIVETRFGYHVIKVEEHKDAGTVSLDEAKGRIKQGLTREAQGKKVQDLLKGLHEKAKIVPVVPEGSPAPATPGK